MKVCNSNINEIGLCRLFASNNFGDLRVIVGGEEIVSSKSVFMTLNTKFKELIESSDNGNTIELFEECSVESFFELERYYSGGYMDINMNNVCEILSMCIYYTEYKVIPNCMRFIIHHLNEEIIVKLIKLIDIYKNIQHEMKNVMNEMKSIFNEYVNKNGYKLLNEEYMKELDVKDLKRILKEVKYIKNNEN